MIFKLQFAYKILDVKIILSFIIKLIETYIKVICIFFIN